MNARPASLLQRILRDPLTHFAVVALLLFTVYTLFADQADTDPRTVRVDRDALLEFIQYRTRSFDPAAAEQRLLGMSAAERQALIDSFVREEVLHREALDLGLDVSDYVIRRRLVQKMEFLAEGIAAAGPEPGDEELRTFLADRQDDYRAAASVTFAHVFIDTNNLDPEAARRAAADLHAALVDSGATFEDATRHGDRFLYHVNYVDRPRDLVASHFGPQFADTVFRLRPSDTAWYGPLESEHGLHLVSLRASTPQRLPEFAELRERLLLDASRQRTLHLKDRQLDALVARYDVRVSGDLADLPAGDAAQRR